MCQSRHHTPLFLINSAIPNTDANHGSQLQLAPAPPFCSSDPLLAEHTRCFPTGQRTRWCWPASWTWTWTCAPASTLCPCCEGAVFDKWSGGLSRKWANSRSLRSRPTTSKETYPEKTAWLVSCSRQLDSVLIVSWRGGRERRLRRWSEGRRSWYGRTHSRSLGDFFYHSSTPIQRHDDT